MPPPITKQQSPKPLQPLTPPPPLISSEKDNWANFKLSEPTRNDSNRIIRPLRINKFNKTPQNEKRGEREYNEKNLDRNIEKMMRDAADQLDQGTITKAQYNKLIQEVLHMSENQMLRVAQRKEWENKVWERNDKSGRMKDHGIHPRPSGNRIRPITIFCKGNVFSN